MPSGTNARSRATLSSLALAWRVGDDRPLRRHPRNSAAAASSAPGRGGFDRTGDTGAETTYHELRKVSPLLASRNGLDTAEDSMAVIATKIAELVAVEAELVHR